MSAHWHRRRVSFAVAAAAGLLAWSPRLFSPPGELTALERFGVDFIHALQPPREVSDVRLIEMDQRSFRARGEETAGLWDRALHARLLRKLANDGARLVVFDVLFDKATSPAADDSFAAAIRAHGKVALAATRAEVVRPGLSGFEPVFPIAKLKEAAAGVGMVNFVKDRDGAVRRPFLESEQHPSLPRVAAQLAGAAALTEINPAHPRWLNYYGPPQTVLPSVSYEDALEQPDDYFRDQFVFVGSTLHIKRPGENPDFFRTPFTRWSGAETPGVALVATSFLNLIRSDSLQRSSALLELLLILVMAFIVSLAGSSFRPLAATGLVLLLGLIAVAMGFLLQSAGQILFPWMIPAAIVAPCAWVWSMVVVLKDRRTLLRAQTAKEPAPAAEAESSTALAAHIPDHTLLRAVGRGAYGEVWVARNAVGLLHAVKIIYRRAFADDAPYEREFRGVTKFMPISRTHPGFVHVLHVGRDDKVGCFYCIMEAADDVVNGTDINPDTYRPKNLATHLQERRRLPPQECLDLGLHLSAALDHLHQSRLIHRDIKPGNIIFVRGAPKLADIGLVTDVPQEPGAVTYLGTMGYIAPEGPGTPAADIYSLGKVLYEIFTGLDRERFPDLPTSLIATPSAEFFRLNAIILKACEMDVRRRYQSAAELRADLQELQRQLAAEK